MNSVPWSLAALAALSGVVVGTAINFIVFRLPQHDSVMNASLRCDSCLRRIRPRFNVPLLGWLAKHHCRACGHGISRRYLAMEAGTGVLFAAVTLRFGATAELPAYLFLAAVGVGVAAIDVQNRQISDTVLLPAYIVSLLLLVPAGAAQLELWPALRATCGMLALSAIYLALVVAYPTGLSSSDVKLAGLLGLYLGWLSWGAVLIGAMGGLLIGGIGASALVASSGRHRLTVTAYGSCMVAATGFAVFAAVPLATWYGSLLAAS
ncbi:MAG: A24 family peptidase [Jatrophihabitantaceae bacterium]